MPARKNRHRRPATFGGLTRGLDIPEIKLLVGSLAGEEARSVEDSWRSWSHGGQKLPVRPWRTWVIMAGRGFGKTRAGAEWIKQAVAGGPPLRIALVAATIDEARRVMLTGESGLLRVARHHIHKWLPSMNELHFDNGSIATLFSGAGPERLRGPEHHIAWCDELAKWDKAQETWDNLQLGMRLGEHPRVLVTTTPRPGAVLKRIIEDDGTAITGGHTRANRHLPKAFIAAVEGMYAGTRLGKQELEGELLTDTPGALWSVELLERVRINPPHPWGGGRREASDGGGTGIAPTMGVSDIPLHHPADRPPPHGWGGFTRTVIGVDPPTGAGTCGIVACARDDSGHLHVLADHSVTGVTANAWAQKVASAAVLHDARYVVAEDNQGGAMVTEVLTQADRKLVVRPVTARTSKSDRAVPIATAFERGGVSLHGHFPELEAQLCGMIAGGAYEGPGRSPDRADAMVWALTDLLAEKPMPRVRML